MKLFQKQRRSVTFENAEAPNERVKVTVRLADDGQFYITVEGETIGRVAVNGVES